MKQIYWTILFVLCLSNLGLFAQKMTVSEWGKIQESDLSMTACAWDSSAQAMVLQDVGKIKLFYSERGLEQTFSRSKRIKVFDPSILDKGNLRIFYNSNRQEEKFEDLDIQIFLPDGTLKKVKSDNVFTETVTERLNAKKIFIPYLQKGCIIEYRYKLRSSDPYTLYDWYFQEDIPTRWSQVEMSLPELADFAVLARKPKEYDLFETRLDKPEVFSKIQHNNLITTYGFANLPGLHEDEPFMTTVDDYRAHIWFDKKIALWVSSDTVGWSAVSIAISMDEYFGGQYRDSLNNLAIWKAFQETLKRDSFLDSLQLPEMALRFVGNHIKWNGEFHRGTLKGVDQAFAQGSGTSAEINLAIVSLLRRFGLKSYPMLISTRDNGEPIVSYPYFKQFNTVVAYVIQGKDSMMLDATNPFHAVNQLNAPCYNKKGWVVRVSEPFWVDIHAPEESATWFGELTLSEAGEARGRFTINVTGETASYWRQKLDQSADKGDFIKKEFAPDYPEASLDSIAFFNIQSFSKPLQVKFNCVIPNTATVINDYLYVRPIIDFLVQKNPFSSPERKFPVSFIAPLKSNYVLNLTLPPDYSVEEIPEKALVSLPEKGGRVQFNSALQENHQVQVLLKMNISRLEFTPEEYPIIRMFFDLVAEKAQLQLVLKKK